MSRVYIDTGVVCSECGKRKWRYSTRCKTCENQHRGGVENGRWAGGKFEHPLYEIYTDMLGRCRRPTHKRYASYGGRGIYVCDRWLADFWNFVNDMGPRPAGRTSSGKRPAYVLDRTNNDGPYSPENCRWVTQSESVKNRRDSAYDGWRKQWERNK
jgi:hypothetical protein